MDALIADNSPFMRRLLRSTLEAEHTVVGAAENGVEVVELYEQRDPDLVVLELGLPIRDGVDAAAEILAADDPPTVVACTSANGESDVEAAERVGLDGYVTKPYRQAGLLTEVEQASGG